MSLVRRMFGHLFTKRYLLVTNTIGSGILMGVGDLGVQLVEKSTGKETGQFNIDWHRTGQYATRNCLALVHYDSKCMLTVIYMHAVQQKYCKLSCIKLFAHVLE